MQSLPTQSPHQTLLRSAITANNIDLVEDILKNNLITDINENDPIHGTFLHCAASAPQPNYMIMLTLLESGANPTIKNQNQETPLNVYIKNRPDVRGTIQHLICRSPSFFASSDIAFNLLFSRSCKMTVQDNIPYSVLMENGDIFFCLTWEDALDKIRSDQATHLLQNEIFLKKYQQKIGIHSFNFISNSNVNSRNTSEETPQEKNSIDNQKPKDTGSFCGFKKGFLN